MNPDVGMLAGEPAGGSQLFGAGGQCKTRRDCIAEAPLVMPLLDQCLAITVRRLGIVAQLFGTVAVHQHFAGNQSHVTRRRRFKNRVCRMWMHGAKHQGCRSAIEQQLLDKGAGDLTSMVGIGKLRLGGIRVAIQPVEQLLTVRADDIELRIMHVTVDEARHDQFVRVLRNEHIVTERLQQLTGIAERLDMAVCDDQQAIRKVLVGRRRRLFAGIFQAVHDRGAIGLTHGGQNASSTTVSLSVRSSQLGSLPPRSMTRNWSAAANAISGMCQVPRW